MGGLLPQHKEDGLRLGWSKEELGEVDGLLVPRGLSSDVCGHTRLLFGGRFVVYRGRGVEAPRRALECARTAGKVIVHADASTSPPAAGGLGAVVTHPWLPEPHLLVGEMAQDAVTNNRAELAAVFLGLQEVCDLERHVLVKTDSSWTIGALTNPRWHVTKHLDLLQVVKVDLLLRGGRVRIEHVPGHAGVPGNEAADRLAHAGRVGKGVGVRRWVGSLDEFQPKARSSRRRSRR